jgi:uncharacterized protein involved in type VI secretion and phage assembly
MASDVDTIVERLGSSIFDRLTSRGRKVVKDERPTDFSDAALIAKSALKAMLEGMYEGSGSCIGMPELRAGDQIEIGGLGKRFSGRYRLSKVTHTINSAGYQTRFEVSQQSNLSLLGSVRDKIAERPSPRGKQPIQGVLVGEVVVNDDSTHPGKLQIKIGVLSDDPLPAWADLAVPMAGESKGLYFLPAKGDTVLVAFEEGDVNKPYVVGALWHGTDRPPDAGAKPGEQKAIKTKSGLQVLFDETKDKERLVLSDKAGASITLDSTKNAEKVLVQDKIGAKVCMDAQAQSIVIECPMPDKKVAKIRLDAKAKNIAIEYAPSGTIIMNNNGTVSIVAEQSLELRAKGGDITLNANNVNVKVTGAMDLS